MTESGEIKLNEAENYPFSFLTDKESQKLERKIEDQIKPCYWFKVGESLYWDNDEDINVYYQALAAQIQSTYQDQKIFLAAFEQHQEQVLLGLKTLHTRLHDEKLISYFQVHENDLENILKIFVRVNDQHL